MAKDSLKEKAYQMIKTNIISCAYEPGAFLNETELMEMVGTSRTPIREALNKLEQENLVKIIAKKCIIVSELAVHDVGDIYQVRVLIEPQMILLWGKDISKKKLSQYIEDLKQAQYKTERNEKYALDDTLHTMILDVCQNNYLIQMMKHLQDQNYRIRVMAGSTDARLSQSVDEHIIITDLLLADDYTEAANAMLVHLENAKKAAFDCLQSRSARRG